MATVGERLREAREQAGLTLQDVADRTKVQRWILAALENDESSRVPGGVFIRGYLTSFATEVGLKGERIWKDYCSETTPPTAEPAPRQPQAVPTISRWTLLRVAAIVLVAAVVWRNIQRVDPDTVAPSPEALEQRVADVVLPAAVVATPAIPAPDIEVVVASPTPKPPAVTVAAAAPAPPVPPVPSETSAVIDRPVVPVEIEVPFEAPPPRSEDSQAAVGTEGSFDQPVP